MEVLSGALVLIFIFYLIDKNDKWGHAFKIAAWSTAISLAACVVVYAWVYYADHKQGNAGKIDLSAGLSPKETDTGNPCWSKPNAATNLQIDQNAEQDLNGKHIPRDSNIVCYPLVETNQPAFDPDAPYQSINNDRAVDCYDKEGHVLVDGFSKLGGFTTQCAPGDIQVPKGTPLRIIQQK